MLRPRPDAEVKYVMGRLEPILAKLAGDRELMGKFLAYASKCGDTDAVSFAVRLSNTTGTKRRPPSVFTAVVLLDFALSHGFGTLVMPSKRLASRKG